MEKVGGEALSGWKTLLYNLKHIPAVTLTHGSIIPGVGLATGAAAGHMFGKSIGKSEATVKGLQGYEKKKVYRR